MRQVMGIRVAAALVATWTGGLAGCATGSPAVAPPDNRFESIHTLIQAIHLDYQHGVRRTAWNPVEHAAFGTHSSERTRIQTLPGTRPISLDFFSGLRNSPGTVDEKPNKRTPTLTHGARLETRDTRTSVRQFKHDLDEVTKTIVDYCHRRGGALHQVELDTGDADTLYRQPVEGSENSARSTLRLMCVGDVQSSSPLPFFVDMYLDYSRVEGISLVLSGTEPNDSAANSYLLGWPPVDVED